MKKIFILLFSLAALTSCSNDDENTPDGPDPLLGVWFISEVNNPFSDDGELNECNKRSSIEFKEDNSATTTFFDDASGECVSVTTSSTWSNLGDSKYEIDIPEFGLQQGRIDFNGSSSFQFNPSSVPGVSIIFIK